MHMPAPEPTAMPHPSCQPQALRGYTPMISHDNDDDDNDDDNDDDDNDDDNDDDDDDDDDDVWMRSG